MASYRHGDNFSGAIMNTHQRIKAHTRTILLSVSYIALAAAGANEVRAQAAPSTEQAPAAPSDATPSPPAAPAQQAPSTPPDASPSRGAGAAAFRQRTECSSVVAGHRQPCAPQAATARSVAQVSRPSAPPPSAPPPSAIQLAWPSSATQDARTGTVGVYPNSTSVATKVNTPIVNIPQSLSVVTKEFITDNSFQNMTDITRYVPGVAVHQGEGNRDELIIRGVDSSANFFVNGFRDDVQIFPRLLQCAEHRNPQRTRVRSPSVAAPAAACSTAPSRRPTANGYTRRRCRPDRTDDRRATLDAGQAVNENFAVRLNVMYEKSDTFRQLRLARALGHQSDLDVQA